MQAIVQQTYGSADVLALRELPDPVAGPDEIIVRVQACAVTPADIAFREGRPWVARLFSGVLRPRNPVPGLAFAGEVENVGARVTRFERGDRVFGSAMTAGGHAERVRVRQDAVVTHLPDELTWAEGLGAEGSHTALWFLREVAGVRSSDRVLVNGASGEVGSTAVQLAKHFGAEVTAVCSGRNAAWVRELGADHVVDYTVTPLREVAGPFELWFDAVGKSSFGVARPQLAPGARYLTTVPSLAILLQMAWTFVFRGKRAGIATAGLHQSVAQLEELAELVRTGVLRPRVDRSYPLAEAAAAHRYVETGRKRGSVLLCPPSPATEP